MSEPKLFQRAIDYGSSFLRWIWEVVKKLFWVLGLPSLALDLASIYIPVQHMPKPIRNLLEKGGNWRLTAILGGLGILLSAYSVYREVERDLEECRSDLREVRGKHPDIAVGFQDDDGHLVETLRLQSEPMPEPDLDALIEEKKEKLISKRDRASSRPSFLSFGLPEKPNPHYEAELERHLVEYREWLVKMYRHVSGMVRCVSPVVENRGNCAAAKVVLEFEMPPAYEKPSEDLDPRYAKVLEKQGYAPEEILEMMFPEPEEPRAFISVMDEVFSESYDLHLLDQVQQASNVDGPRYEVKEGQWHITYTVESLIQGRTEDSFKPFLVWLGDFEHTAVWDISVSVDVGQPSLNLEQTVRLKIDVQVPSAD